MADLSPIDTARFWSRVTASADFQCWEWTGQKNGRGYGRFRGQMAHRLAYELVSGPIPVGQIIRHRCDNPSCCNPAHLEPGTSAENTDDALRRGRLPRGIRHGRTKLEPWQVDYIRRNPEREKQVALAQRFGVSPSTVSYIRSGRSWKGDYRLDIRSRPESGSAECGIFSRIILSPPRLPSWGR